MENVILFKTPDEGLEKNFFSVYLDTNGTKWIKFWGYFCGDTLSKRRPWRMMEYFAADFLFTDFLLMTLEQLHDNLTEIKQIIGNFSGKEALYGMNHFFQEYCYPPDNRRVMRLPLSQITDITPCGLYVEA